MTELTRFDKLAQLPMKVLSGDKKPRSSLASVREVFSRREMLGLLVRRDLKSRYKDSVLGFTWTLIRPLIQLLIYYVVIGKFMSAERGIPNFAIYVFAGLTAYGYFSEMISSSTSSILNNAGLVKKIYMPREVFPLAAVGSATFNFLMQFVILIAATLIARNFPLTPDVVYLIPSVLILLVYGMALGLLFSALNVYLRDIQYLVEVVLLLMLWASPIVYSWEMVKKAIGDSLLLEIYTDNPVTLAVLGFQRAIWIAGHNVVAYPDNLMPRMLVALVIGIIGLILAQRVFSRLQGNFAQEV